MHNQNSTSSLAGPHARGSVSQVKEGAWVTGVLISRLSLSEFLQTNVRSGSFGKTCRECLVAPAALTLQQSLEVSPDNELPRRNSLSPASYNQPHKTIIPSPTGYLIADISECHSAAGVSLLSGILEPTGDHLLRYSLSAKACAGILRRAETRGKALPPILKEALEQVVLTE